MYNIQQKREFPTNPRTDFLNLENIRGESQADANAIGDNMVLIDKQFEKVDEQITELQDLPANIGIGSVKRENIKVINGFDELDLDPNTAIMFDLCTGVFNSPVDAPGRYIFSINSDAIRSRLWLPGSIISGTAVGTLIIEKLVTDRVLSNGSNIDMIQLTYYGVTAFGTSEMLPRIWVSQVHIESLNSMSSIPNDFILNWGLASFTRGATDSFFVGTGIGSPMTEPAWRTPAQVRTILGIPTGNIAQTETGTWTPGLSGAIATAAFSLTHTRSVFTRVGGLCNIQSAITLTRTDTNLNVSLTFLGLPFSHIDSGIGDTLNVVSITQADVTQTLFTSRGGGAGLLNIVPWNSTSVVNLSTNIAGLTVGETVGSVINIRINHTYRVASA